MEFLCLAMLDTHCRSRVKYSPIRHAPPVKTEAHKGSRSLERRRPISSRSPQRDIYDLKDSRKKESLLPPRRRRSPSVSESPRSRSASESLPTKRERSPSENRGYMLSLIILLTLLVLHEFYL